MARRVDQQGVALCASPAYLAQRGTPRRIEDLADHSAIVFRLSTSGRDRPWQFRQRGTAIDLNPQPHVRVSETEALVDALKLGMGLCQVPDLLVQDELARGELVEVLPSCRPETMPISVVYPTGKMVPARVRVAIDALDALRKRHARSQ